ncbi:hypothetical protein ICW40_06490 [Actinotalea ferrariae]|uniref:hypothetical protein n=1 Tax=Actinotalea ferrariae TaxID=1386098 RepID=UPI001C8CD6A4|nr:hypothetical protein [Actinotalea ferrariae]MBX9244453.1 hypothetical protein [Actinotalea ferrariae]
MAQRGELGERADRQSDGQLGRQGGADGPSSPDDRPDDGRGRRPLGRARQALRVVVAFLTGVLLTAAAGLVLTSLGVIGDGDRPATSARDEPADGTDDDPDGAAGPTGDVPRACVRAAEYNETLTEAIDEIALALRDQDARRAAEALDAVQDAQPGSEQASRECREAAGEESDDGSGEDAAP